MYSSVLNNNLDEETPISTEESALPPIPTPMSSMPVLPIPIPSNIKEQQERTGIVRIQLSFELDKLTNTRGRLFPFLNGGKDKTCPYVLVTTIGEDGLDGDDGGSRKIGKTETAWSSLSTRFCEPVYINHPIDCSSNDISPYVKVSVYDNRSRDELERTLEEAGEDSNDTLLCEHLLDLGSMKEDIEKDSYSFTELLFVNKGSETLRKDQEDLYHDPSYFNICGHYSIECSDRLEIHFRALGVKNVEKGYFNLTRTDPLFVICKKHVGTTSGKVHWQAVYRSEHIPDHLNPLWEADTVNLEQLCDGNDNTTLQVEIWDYEASGRNRIVGRLHEELTLMQLRSKKALRGNADRTNGLFIDEVLDDPEINPNPAGVLVVLKADPCARH